MPFDWTDARCHSVMEDDKKMLIEYGLKDGDLVVIERRGDKWRTPTASDYDIRLGFGRMHHERQCPICAWDLFRALPM